MHSRPLMQGEGATVGVAYDLYAEKMKRVPLVEFFARIVAFLQVFVLSTLYCILYAVYVADNGVSILFEGAMHTVISASNKGRVLAS